MPTNNAQDQLSNELRYSGTFGKADVTTGLYYFNQDIGYDEVRMLPPLSPLTFYGGGSQDHQVLGIFGQVDYAFTDRLTATVGLRYSEEDKSANVTFVRPRPACSVIESSCPTSGTNPFVPTENNGFNDEDSWSNFTPKLGLEYSYSDNLLAYGSYTKGFRSGGYNFRVTNAALFADQVALTGQPAFDEEEVDAFDVGIKFDTDDRRGRLNVSAFYTDISDMQREINISSPTAGVSQFILNTADASILGFEAEGSYRILDNLLFNANIGLMDADYDRVGFDISGDGIVDDADKALDIPRVAKATYGIGFIHDVDFTEGGLTTTLNYQHRDRNAFTDNNLGFIQAAGMLNGNLAWRTPVEGVTLSLYGKNLLDEVQAGGDTQIPFGGALAGLAPGGANLSNDVNVPYDNNPAGGTFSPLKKGRVIGVELTWKN